MPAPVTFSRNDSLLSQPSTTSAPEADSHVDPELAAHARAMAARGIILLRNDDTLPLRPATRLALFGRIQKDWIAVGDSF